MDPIDLAYNIGRAEAFNEISEMISDNAKIKDIEKKIQMEFERVKAFLSLSRLQEIQ